MDITRRSFVGISASSLVLAATGMPFTRLHAFRRPVAVSARMPLHVFVQDPARLAALRRGVQVMKERSPSDPRSWFFQAAVHGVWPHEIEQAAQRDPAVRKVAVEQFWNQCPHGPGFKTGPSADFLIWHRAYLYYFERMLRDAAGDETLSLPYWDYSTDKANVYIPAAFKDPETDSQTGEHRNPLYERRRNIGFQNGTAGLSEKDVSLKGLEKGNFFGPDSLAGEFGGKERTVRGALEGTPHSSVHSAIGGAMGHPRTAAFDPLFWVHHCNVDRLWAQWETQAGKTWGSEPSTDWFEEKPWWFYDVDGVAQNLPRSHYVQRKWLPIAYDFETGVRTALSDVLPTPARVLDLGETLAARDPMQPALHSRIEQLAMPMGMLAFDSGRMQNADLLLSAAGRRAIHKVALQSIAADLNAPVERFVFLEVAGIHEPPEGIGFDVHLDATPGRVPSRSDASFVGTLDLFGVGHGGHDAQLFDITARAEQNDLGERVRITLVPFALLEGGDADEPLPSEADLSFEHVRLLVVEARRR